MVVVVSSRVVVVSVRVVVVDRGMVVVGQGGRKQDSSRNGVGIGGNTSRPAAQRR